MRGLTLRGRIPHTNVVSVATNGRDPAAAIRSLGDAATVVDATPNYVRRALEVPDDPYVGSARPYLDAIRLTQAWDLSHGAGDVTIAVVDTGVSPVADLADRLLPGHNFVQDDDATFDSEPAPDPPMTRGTRRPSGTGRSSRASPRRSRTTASGSPVSPGTRTFCRSRC